MLIRVIWAAVLAACVSVTLSAQKPSPDGRIEIDGSKNPEMIPQWVVWQYAFRVIDGGPRELPTNVYRVASAQERELILAEAAVDVRRDKACIQRIEREIRPLLGKEKVDIIKARQQEIHVECRWQTLHARDRLLERLRPEVQTELIRFVEDTKAGRRLSMPVEELPYYRQPQ